MEHKKTKTANFGVESEKFNFFSTQNSAAKDEIFDSGFQSRKSSKRKRKTKRIWIKILNFSCL